MKENDLQVLEEIVPISARLIANVVSMKFKQDNIELIRSRLEEQVNNRL